MADAKGVPKFDVVERAFRPDEIESPERLLRAGHVPDEGTGTSRQPAPHDGRPQPFDARRMGVDGYDRTRGEFGELQSLSSDTAPQVEDRRASREFAAQRQGAGGAGAVAGPLPGQVLVDLEEDLPETRSEWVHAACPSRRSRSRSTCGPFGSSSNCLSLRKPALAKARCEARLSARAHAITNGPSGVVNFSASASAPAPRPTGGRLPSRPAAVLELVPGDTTPALVERVRRDADQDLAPLGVAHRRLRQRRHLWHVYRRIGHVWRSRRGLALRGACCRHSCLLRKLSRWKTPTPSDACVARYESHHVCSSGR